jgi:formylglycine-generating enzyme required for sulfatase activity/predicted Ser/Thr protein kinase
MSGRAEGSSDPLDSFLDQFAKDLDARVSRTLEEYLALFPGDTERIAEEYLALKRYRDLGAGARPDGVPSQIGRYRVLKELGRGGQGIVYLAKDLNLGREVAIKTLKRSALALEELQRLQREARIASRLDHPGICPIYEIGDFLGSPYLVMRYVRGTTLASKIHELRKAHGPPFSFIDVDDGDCGPARDAAASSGRTEPGEMRREPLPAGPEINAVLRLIEQVARALHEAHEAGIIHRDVKPANIMVANDGQPVLLDFGVATMLEDGGAFLTRTGETPGTPPYMSPEQTSGKLGRLDRRTDIYSLGVTLYECVTLRLPFSDPHDIARQIMVAAPPDPRTLNPAISRVLKTVVDTTLEKDRGRRYQTAADLADDLRRVREHEPIKARPVGAHVRVARWAQRNPLVAASLALTFAILAVALVLTTKAWSDARVAWVSERDLRETLDRQRALNAPLADLRRIADLASWSDRLWPPRPEKAGGEDGMASWVREAEALLDRQPGHRKALDAYESGGGGLDATERAACIRCLNELLPELSKLPGRIREMRTRLENASSIVDRTIVRRAAAWADVAARLGADPAFASISPLEPQIGLVPIGRNEAGLFEFVLEDSGAEPDRRGESRTPIMTEDTAAILVLLPGGTVRFDPSPEPDTPPPPAEALVAVTVPPFFMGKHEVTQSQWARLFLSNPAILRPGRTPVKVTEVHPVENVNWKEAAEFCRRLGVRLPTQDEWEYAARSTTGSEFGDCDTVDCLEGRENLADQTYIAVIHRRPAEPMAWEDGAPYHAPVGSFRANGFGLHDMLGNVSEWCSDVFSRPRVASDAAALQPEEQRRVTRGSSWQDGAREASCRRFRGIYATVPQPNLGFRIARSIDRGRSESRAAAAPR